MFVNLLKMKRKTLEKYLDFALTSVRKSEKISLKYYNKKIKHRLKYNQTPVTVADIKTEDYLINRIRQKFPSHSILSEERGYDDTGSEFKWIIDPIDGTKNYLRKYPFWGTLLALEWEGEIVLGIISMPAIKQLIYSVKSSGCYMNGKKVKVSGISNISNSYLMYGCMNYMIRQPYMNNFLSLTEKCSHSRGFGDCYGHSLVITGKADIMIDPLVAPHDIAAVKICIEEAGGILTDFNGNNSIYNGNAVVTNGYLHKEVLKILSSGFESRDVMMLEK